MRVPTRSIINTLEAIDILIDRPIPTENIWRVKKSFIFKVKRAEKIAELIGVLKMEVGIEDEGSAWIGAGNTIAELYGTGVADERMIEKEINVDDRGNDQNQHT